MFDPSGFFIQFIRLAGPFWKLAKYRNLALVLTVLTLMQIAIAVVITMWSAALFNALEQKSMAGLLAQIGFLVLILAANMFVTGTHLKVKRRLQLEWRNWLTDKIVGRWMNDGRHYQITHMQGNHDNPDGRIAEDIRISVEAAIDLCHSLFYCSLMLVSFTKILWTLSGTVTLSLGGIDIPIYGHLVWIAILYATTASYLGWLVGNPLIKATDTRQTTEANFRFRLVKERENSLAIALIHSEPKEQHRLSKLFHDIVRAWELQTKAWANILMFTSGYSVLSMAFPILVSAPRYISGSIPLGSLMQSAQAFQHMASALSWPVDNMARVAEWRTSVERVLGLLKALDDLQNDMSKPDPNRIVVEKNENPILGFHNLTIARQNGDVLLANINDEIRHGERVLFSCDAHAGASLFKAIAGLWPWGTGRIELPDDDPMFFMPPRPYLPSGPLRAAICYPSGVERIDQKELEEIIWLVGVGELLPQLEHVDTWDKALSREQQQRLGMVRLLLHKPKWILLQEAFDSLDPEGEAAMLRLICERLPDAAMLTLTNHPSVELFHHRRIILSPYPQDTSSSI